MQLDFTLTKKQDTALKAFTAKYPHVCWWVQRIEGTGLKFWRMTYSMRPDWEGKRGDVDGRTFAEMMTLAEKAVQS
jgi:hypothetical protein